MHDGVHEEPRSIIIGSSLCFSLTFLQLPVQTRLLEVDVEDQNCISV